MSLPGSSSSPSSSSPPFMLTLVRHGQTSANKAHIIQGSSDFPLSEIGREQARKLGAYFNENGVTFTHVYSSDLSRAQKTAELAVGTAREIKLDPRLRERAFGVIEGKSVNFYRLTAHEAGFKYREQGSYIPEGAETVTQVAARVEEFFGEMLKHLAETSIEEKIRVLIVTHGGVIKQFMKIFTTKCECECSDARMTSRTPNTAVSIFTVTPQSSGKMHVEVIQLHDISHLQSGETTTSTPTKSALPEESTDSEESPPKRA